jgi:3-dehydroquinate dehydratase-1
LVRVCVSIANEKLKTLYEQINRAFDFGADYVEIRFDFFKLDELEQAMSIAEPFRKKAVFTLRSPREQGRFKWPRPFRIAWLKRLAAVKPMLLDVELQTLKDNCDLLEYLRDEHANLLVSWHDFKATPPYKELSCKLEQMGRYSKYIKIITTAKNVQDTLRILDLYDEANGLNLIAFAMGEVGTLSRILCPIAGNAPFTYATLEKAIAPGQLTLEQMRKLYSRIDGTSLGKDHAERG